LISSAPLYLFILALIASSFHLLEAKFRIKLFAYIPAVVMIYALSMLLASLGVFEKNETIGDIYSLAKTNLLPAMLFLMLLQVDLRDFVKLGKSLLYAYLLAVFSLGIAFIFISILFRFDGAEASAFGALAGSWMGGTANMIAVGSALGISNEAYGYALIVDSVNYTLWVIFLLLLIPFAPLFNRWSSSKITNIQEFKLGCSCTIGPKRYWLLLFLALGVSLLVQISIEFIPWIGKTTGVVVLATFLGILGSFTKLKEINGSSEIATTMLYLLIALIGSQAFFESFETLGTYVLAGFLILVFHASVMVLGAKLLKLDLFSIAVASLSNIGGVASAPILAAAYNKSLVGVGVLMAVMGYIIGTFGGLLVGNILLGLAQ
jgi:uncharacterized membrane protein